MTDHQSTIDILQRIAAALSRTSEPAPNVHGLTLDDNKQVVGSLPLHLRHIHNLVDDLTDEVQAAQHALWQANNRLAALQHLFFDAVAAHMPQPPTAIGMGILTNWDVVAVYNTLDDSPKSASAH